MSKIPSFVRLSAVALLVAWYQLPVLAERSHALTLPGQPQVSQALESARDTVGQPAVALRAWSEQQKLRLQAGLLDAATPAKPRPGTAPAAAVVPVSRPSAVAPTAHPVAPPVAPSAPAVAAVIGNTSPAVAPPVPPAPAGKAAGAPPQLDGLGAVPGPAGAGVVAVLAGDSVMGEIAFGMKRWAAKTHVWTVVDAHKVSSGLSNTGYYDWPATFHSLLEAHHPQVMLMMVGANDGQDIFEGGHRQGFGSAAWLATYGARIDTILKDAAAHCTTVYWTLPPVVRDAALEKRLAVIRQVIRERTQAHGETVRLIDAGASFADAAGHYVDSARVQGKMKALRADDGVHLTWAGAQVFVDAVLEDAQRRPVGAAGCANAGVSAAAMASN
jgi:lysophospholipase L1-like esterase